MAEGTTTRSEPVLPVGVGDDGGSLAEQVRALRGTVDVLVDAVRVLSAALDQQPTAEPEVTSQAILLAARSAHQMLLGLGRTS